MHMLKYGPDICARQAGSSLCAHMDSVKTRIDEIQKDMDSAWSELRRQAYRLASLAGRLEDGPLTLISPSLRTAFLDAERSFNAVNSRNRRSVESTRESCPS